MPIITDDEAALATLRRLVQPNADPVLSDDEFRALLDPPYKRASVWVAATAYAYGDVIIPATRNGRRFICTVAGTSGATEPGWPTSREATVSDGTVTWEESGREYDLWDFYKAAAEGWRLKLAKASAYKNVAVGDVRSSRSEVFEHCQEMVRQYSGVELG